MSMIGNYRRITIDELALLRQHPETISIFLYSKTSAQLAHDRVLDIDKTWHTIHFLLTGQAWEGEPPLYNVVFGGTPLGDQDVGYGPARFLLPAQVRETAVALAAIPFSSLQQRFDLNRLAAADIYPSIWEDTDRDDELLYLQPYYQALVQFFEQAAQNNDAILLFIN